MNQKINHGRSKVIKDIVYAILITVAMFVVQAIGIIAGLVLVPIGLLFRTLDQGTMKRFTTFNTDRFWVKEDLPNWLRWYQNDEDGLRGDHRGWWDANSFGGDSSKVFNMFWWSAIRNPLNYFKRFVIGCDVRNYEIVKLAGKDHVRDDFESTGFQFLKAIPKKDNIKLPRYMLYYVLRYGKTNRALVIQIGNKIKLDHNNVIEEDEYDYYKGFTVEINPFKDIS